MALSNILREPRRELIETWIGVVVVCGWAWLDWKWANWCIDGVQFELPHDGVITEFFLLLAGIVIPFLVFGLLQIAHKVGEVVCGWLADAGHDPRPRQRR